MSLLIRLPLHYLIKNPHYDITHYVIFSFTYLVLSGLFYTVFLSNLIPVRLQFVIYLESPISFYFKGEIKFLFCLFSFFVTARECVLKHGDVHRIRGQAWGIQVQYCSLLNLSSRQGWMVKATRRTLYPWERERYPQYRSLNGPQAQECILQSITSNVTCLVYMTNCKALRPTTALKTGWIICIWFFRVFLLSEPAIKFLFGSHDYSVRCNIFSPGQLPNQLLHYAIASKLVTSLCNSFQSSYFMMQQLPNQLLHDAIASKLVTS